MIREILTFGAVVLGGGYLAKRYWDKKKAEKAVILNKYESEILVRKQFYRLEESFHKTDKILINLMDKIGALGLYDDDRLKVHKYNLAYKQKCELHDFVALDEVHKATFITQAWIILGFLGEICEELKTKEVWLDEIAQSLGESRESDSWESLPEQTKIEIVELVSIMQYTHWSIAFNFSESKSRDDMIVELQKWLNEIKSHPSESNANQS